MDGIADAGEQQRWKSSSNAEDHRLKWVEVRKRTRELIRKNGIERIENPVNPVILSN